MSLLDLAVDLLHMHSPDTLAIEPFEDDTLDCNPERVFLACEVAYSNAFAFHSVVLHQLQDPQVDEQQHQYARDAVEDLAEDV